MASQFDQTYTNADLANNQVSPYDSKKFESWRQRLEAASTSSTQGLSRCILAVILLAQRRGEVIGPVFRDSIGNDTDAEAITKTFVLLREAVTIVFPWVGFANCMSGCFGLISELKKHDIPAPTTTQRPGFDQFDYTEKGLATNQKVYENVGSVDARGMIGEYFPDLSHMTDVALFGYLMGGSKVLPLDDCVTLATATVIAIGAMRQARTMTRASIKLGVSAELLRAIVDVAGDMAQWTGPQAPAAVDVEQVNAEVNA